MIKHAGTRTTHTIEVDDKTANFVAGFLWEALDKLAARHPDDTVTVQCRAAATDAMKAFFAAAGHDHGTYTGTNLFTCEHGPTLFADEAAKPPTKRAGTR